MKGYSKYFWLFHFLGDFVLINVSFLFTYHYKFDSFILNDNYSLLLVIFNFIWIFIAFMLNIYAIKRLKRVEKILFNLLKIFVINIFVLSSFLFTLDDNSPFSREHLLLTYLFAFFLVLIWRYISIQVIFLYRKYGYNYDRVLIVGGGDIGKGLYDYFFSDDILGVKLLGIFSDSNIIFKTNVSVFSIDKIKSFSIEKKIDEIYYTLPLKNTEEIQDLVEFCDNNLIRFKVVPDFRGFPLRKVNIDFFDNVPVLSFRQEPLKDSVNRFIKRLFDIIFSILVLILIFPWLFPIISFLIKISSNGPVFFKQKRSGLDNKEFWCYKFRSMTQNIDADKKQATKDDIRITKVGSFLRKTSLDEFPQFINVLFGNMSVVGPRPHMIKHTQQYSKLINKYMVRQLVKPGITGMAQIKGFRGETRELKEMEGRIKWDVWYIENWTFFLDIYIILMTVFNFFTVDEKAY